MSSSPAWPPGSEPDQIVALTAFGGLMVATNLFNNALQVDLDDYLHAVPQGETAMSAAAGGAVERRPTWPGRSR